MRASYRSRLLATAIDLIVGLALGLLLASGPLGHFFSARAVVLLRIGEPDSWFVGPAAMVIGILGELVFLLPLTLMLGLAPEALFGAGPGKVLLGLRIRGSRGGPGARRLVYRYLLKTAPLLLTVMALLTGNWAVQVAAFAVAALAIAQWTVAAARGAQAAHDRLARTAVRRRRRSGR